MFRARDALAVLALLLPPLAGCRTPPPAAPAPQPAAFLLDSFEEDRLWTLDSADNYGTVEYGDRHVTDGARALELRFFDSGRDKTLFRREVRYDLSAAGALTLDVFNHSAGPGVRLALALVGSRGDFFETRPLPLAPGENRDLVFPLGPSGWKQGVNTNAWFATRDGVGRIMLLVFPGQNGDGALTVDNLRADVQGVNQAPEPRVLAFTDPPAVVPCYEPVELAASFDAADLLRPPLARSDKPAELLPLDLEARLIRPDGERLTIRGFLKDRDDAAGVVTFAARFSPDRTGPWRLSFGHVVGYRWRELAARTFRCGDPAGRRGAITVDAHDRRAFAFASGEKFYPIGQNVCWAADYAPYLEAIRAYGGNFVRVWICPWNNPLLRPPNVDRVDLASAAALDRLLDQARANGVYVQLVFAYHGWLGADWSRNPFNAANDGPCLVPQDFWTDPTARQRFRAYLDYAVRRWAAHPNVFAWELMNEAGLTPRYEDEHVLNWHREMAAFLKRVDPYGHLVTTSLEGETRVLARVWELPQVDFVALHPYDPDAERAVSRAAAASAAYGKPHWIQEVGRGVGAAADQADPEGRHLHHALWLSWMSPAAGAALPWWWDTHIEPNRLQARFGALAAYDRDEDRRGQDLAPWTAAFMRGESAHARAQGLIGRQTCYGFVFDPAPMRAPDAAPSRPLLAEGRLLTLKGLLDGDYTVEFWDTEAGKIANRGRVKAENGILALHLPAANRDFAFKVKRATFLPVEVLAE